MLALDPCVDNMMIDEDYMGLMSDTLFSTIANQPYAFPDTREIGMNRHLRLINPNKPLFFFSSLAKAGLADFIQPSLGPLQPNLDDIMDIDPLHG